MRIARLRFAARKSRTRRGVILQHKYPALSSSVLAVGPVELRLAVHMYMKLRFIILFQSPSGQVSGWFDRKTAK